MLSDPTAATFVDLVLPAVGGAIRLRSASGPLESIWIDLMDEDGFRVTFDPATCRHVAAPVRLTPSQAKELAEKLRRYAETHEESGDEE